MFGTFDFANPDMSTGERMLTTVPQQALFMLNSPFVIEQARSLVAKVKPQPEPGEADVQAFFARVFARRAEAAEVESGLRYLRAQLAAEAKADPKPAWQYGSGRYDAAAGKVEFSPLPHWTGTAWQGGPKLPDPMLGWVLLHAHGGHPASDRAAIRRWTAPRDGVISIAGQLAHSEKHGDGVQGRIVSSRAGELLQVAAERGATVDASVARVEVKAGETLDFIVECRANETSDSFSWTPAIHGDLGDFDANIGFAGPPPARATPLTGWEKYAQALLAANEFVFVD
jgi:hypothetical protein